MPGDLALRDGVVAERPEVDSSQRTQRVDRSRPLDRDQSHGERPVVEDRGRAAQALRQGVRHDGRVAGVGDDEEPLVGQAVDDEVVDDAAVRGADHRVVGSTDREGWRIRDERGGERRTGVRPVDEQFAHVREVEQAAALADRPVLLEDARVLDRHEPAAELDEPRAEVFVARV